MRKELLFAIIAGVVFGIIVAFGIWRANTALKSARTATPPSTSNLTLTPAVKTPQEFDLAIGNPEDYDIITESPVVLSGVTSANAWVVISSEDEDYVTQAEGSGSFSYEVNLTGGINNLTITAFDESGKSIQKTLKVVFSSEFAKDAGITPEATESAKP